MSGVALVRDAQGYRLIPTAEAVAAGSADWARDPSAGYGISVIPLQFVSAQTLIKLLDNYAAKPGMVRAEPSRNLIIIQGNSADRRAAIQTALSFDADWMLGQSVGIYPVSNSTPEPIIAELNRIIDSGQGGLSQDLVKLEPIADRTPFSSLPASRSYSKGWQPGSRDWTNRAVRAPTSRYTACATAMRAKSRRSSTTCSSAAAAVDWIRQTTN